MAKKFRARVVTWEDVDASLPWADYTFYSRHILAEGDSWFTLGGTGGGEPPYNLLFGLRLTKSTMVVNCAYPGDTIKNMSQIAGNQRLKAGLSKRDGRQWHLILLSGGGNDLIDEVGEILLNPEARGGKKKNKPEDYCDQTELKRVLDYIQDGYKKIVEYRDRKDAPSAGVPIVTHTYDHPTPNNAPARFFGWKTSGPWLYKAFVDDEVPEKDWIKLADYLFEMLADAILELADENSPKFLKDFHVVDTRGTLKRAKIGSTGASNNWLNEIHPTIKGYKKLGQKVVPKVEELW